MSASSSILRLAAFKSMNLAVARAWAAFSRKNAELSGRCKLSHPATAATAPRHGLVLSVDRLFGIGGPITFEGTVWFYEAIDLT
jgi:hypothetical protein